MAIRIPTFSDLTTNNKTLEIKDQVSVSEDTNLPTFHTLEINDKVLVYNKHTHIKTPKREGIAPNDTWCNYAWNHSYIGSRYERKLCCISGDVIGYEKMSTEEFWNSDYMKSVRKRMIAGEEIEVCRGCYAVEKTGVKSLRQETNENLWQCDINDYIENTGEDGFFGKKPTYYDYRTIHCNIQCQSCGDIYSSQHMKLKEKMWGKDIIASDKPKFFIDAEFEKESTDEMLEGIEEKRIDNIYWAGGEPMMSPMHWKVIEKMTEKYNDPESSDYIKTIQMHYNTNLTKLTWKNKSIPKMLEPFQPSIQASLDGTHETIEYTRDGVSWEQIDKNFKEYFALLNEGQQFGVATVTTAPVLFDIERYLDYYGKYNVYLHPHYNFCRINQPKAMPGFLDIRLYPPDIFWPTIEEVKRKIKVSGLRGSQKWIDTLYRYELEYKDLRPVIEKEGYLEKLKAGQLYRESFNITKRSLTELYEITNPSAKEWIDNVGIIVCNERQRDYVESLNLEYKEEY